MTALLQILFPFLVLLYLADCLTWVRKGNLVFVSHLGGSFRLRASGIQLTGLLPVSEAIISPDLPLIVTPRGVYRIPTEYLGRGPVDLVGRARLRPSADLQSVVVVDKSVRIDGEEIARFPTASCAGETALLLGRLRAASPSESASLLWSHLARAADLPGVKLLRDRYGGWINHIKLISSVLFVVVFVLLPLALYTRLNDFINISNLLLSIAGGYICLMGLGALALRRVGQRSYGEIFVTLLPMVLSPVTALHIASALTRYGYLGFNTVALSAEVLPKEQFHALAREQYARAVHLKSAAEPADLVEYWGWQEEILRRLLVDSGLAVAELMAPPRPEDGLAASFCPLCRSQYVAGFSSCADCGVELQPLA